MDNSNNLGNLVGTYDENKTATTTNLIVGLACLTLTPVMIIFFLGEKEISFNKFLFGFVAFFTVIGGIGAVWSSVKNRGGRVRIYENGLEVEKRGKRQIALWNEITVVMEKVEKIFVNNQYIYDRYSYEIEKKDGETFQLSNMISNINEIGMRIKEKTFENLYPQIVAKINGGEQVAFDSLTVDKNGLSGFPWAEFSSVKLKEGVIEVKDRTGKAVISGAYGATPNAHLLIALLREKLPLED